MQSKPDAPWGLKAIIVFYIVGVAAATITLFTNRAATGRQLAAALGSSHVSMFANIFWPLLMVIYLFVKRRSFSVGESAERLTSVST